jgi:hypothetical protein
MVSPSYPGHNPDSNGLPTQPDWCADPCDMNAAARGYIEVWGWSPIPLPPREKGPKLKEWQNLRVTGDNVDYHFPGDKPQNMGVLLGGPNDPTDVDLDCAEALAVADDFLPPTRRVAGRKSNPLSHRFYRADPRTGQGTEQFRDVGKNKEMLVELRSLGAQTVVPPSVHPSGEAYTWYETGEPAEVGYPELLAAVKTVSAAAILARHWPVVGSRQNCARDLAGGLARAGWTQERVTQFLSAVCRAAADPDISMRVTDVPGTFAKLAEKKPVYGWPQLAKELGDDGPAVVSKARQWLGLGPSANGDGGPTPQAGAAGGHAAGRDGGTARGGDGEAGAGAGGATAGGPSLIDLAVAHLLKAEPAISGQGGHTQTFKVAREVVWGFNLGEEIGYLLMARHYNPRCQPPWSEKELAHKCHDADTKPCEWPRGWLLAPQGGGEDATTSEEWHEPIPLGVTEEPPAFPVEVYPDVVSRFVLEGAGALHCPPDYLAVPVLVGAGVALGAARALAVKGSHVQRGNVYAAVVASPGSMKSPALDKIRDIIHEMEQAWQDVWEHQMEQYREELDKWEEEAKQARKAGGEPPGKRPVRPALPRMTVDDITYEALVPALQENPVAWGS